MDSSSTEHTALIAAKMGPPQGARNPASTSFSKTLVAGSLLFLAALLGSTLALDLSFASGPYDYYSKIAPSKHSSPCGKLSQVAFADMHDGDQKLVSIHHDDMTIQPADSQETWIVHAKLDSSACTATVDFDVPGKPSPPPVPLLLTVWSMSTIGHGHASKLTMEFTDPSETIAPKDMPLNHWVQL